MQPLQPCNGRREDALSKCPHMRCQPATRPKVLGSSTSTGPLGRMEDQAMAHGGNTGNINAGDRVGLPFRQPSRFCLVALTSRSLLNQLASRPAHTPPDATLRVSCPSTTLCVRPSPYS